MTLSIIIVNYNVKYFLEQCLCSVKKAIDKIDAEVIVVDNNSTDGSIEYLKPKFLWAAFIINKTNEGFAKANNHGLLRAKGKYILFLNPDTIVAEDCFEKCISFMESRPQAGAIGVKMIDGSGHYLKESKRGFPSPWVSFCKLSGLTALFPHSKFFSRYYLGYLSEKENQVIDAISGAFMFCKKAALNKTSGFDEQFFMYAEDIDLSYRIQQAGFVNYYFAETTIIHFKGESTKKDYQYVKLFYRAMSLFAKKHFGSKKSTALIILIEAATWPRFALSVIRNMASNKQSKKTQTEKMFLFGDSENKNKLEQLLIVQQKKIAKKEAEADELVFCEGKSFSFKKNIEHIQNASKHYDYRFHANNSSSVVGSNRKNASGEAFELYP